MGKSVQDIDKAFGTRFKMLRKKKGRSQTYVARRCGVTFQQVQKYECGLNRVSISRAYQLAKAIGVDVQELVGGLD